MLAGAETGTKNSRIRTNIHNITAEVGDCVTLSIFSVRRAVTSRSNKLIMLTRTSAW